MTRPASILVGAFGLLVFASASPQRDLDPRPTPQPDRIVLTWNADPATTQAVTWRTDTTITAAYAEIALADANPEFVEDAVVVPAVTTPLETDEATAFYHTAVFVSLRPNTLYAYRVGDGENYWSEWNHFRTASDQPLPFRFIYLGDAQNDIFSMWSRAIREAYSEAPRARFIIHAGDLVNDSDSDLEWHEWFEAGGWIHSRVPSVPVPGNHEYGQGRLTDHWRPQFALPRHLDPDLDETTYTIDFQGLRIIGLNSNDDVDEQAVWLDRELADNPNDWTVVTFHHPVFSAARGRDNPEIREKWKPIFDRHGVDLVLQGHDHAYGRGDNLPSGLRTQDTEAGTVYVVSVSGPKMYSIPDDATWRDRAAEDIQLFQVIDVSRDLLSYRAMTVTGELYDAFQIVRGADGAKRFVDGASRLGPERTE